jgi:AsmA protein
MEFNFGLRDVQINLPHVKNEISDLNMEGTFNSGIQSDFSEAQLSVNHLTGKLPGGFIDARLSIHNFVVPSIDLSWDMKTDVTGFDKIFNIIALDSLHGNISLHHELLSVFNPETGYMNIEKGRSLLLFDGLAFNIPGILQVKNLNGEIQNNKDTLKFSDFRFNANNSGITINGSIENLYSVFFQEDKDIRANLTIESDTFDLPAVFSYDPRVENNFPYKIIDLEIKVDARTTTSKLKEFNSNPEIVFEISNMSGTIQNLFPPVTIHKGTMILSEKNERLMLNFNDFDMEVAQAGLFAQVDYHSTNESPNLIHIDVEVKELNPGRLFLLKLDTIPSFANGLLNGTFSSTIETGLDTINFNTFKLNAGEFAYRTQKDTFDIKDLNVDAKNIYVSRQERKNMLETLLAEIELEIGQINSNYFKEKDIAYSIIARNGSVTLTPEKSQLFGKKGEGSFKLSPYKDVPVYEIEYNVNQFLIDDFLANILSDTILTGKMNLDIDVTLTESEHGNVFSSMNGSINLNGTDMTLHGVDIDKVIEKYNKSQKFDLLDVGATVIAGPFGLALTKGSDFAKLALGNIGESTHITNFISEWEMVNGRISLKDVAFATEENRIAGLGWIDLSTDRMEVTMAVLDTKGCSVLKQTLSGPLDSLQHTEIKIGSTVLGPVTNLVNGALGKDCKVVYDGKLTHPPKRKKNSITE